MRHIYKCPISYFTDNLIFTDAKDCWAVFELQGFSYDMLSNAAKIGVLNRLTLFLSNISREAKILMIPFTQNLDQHFGALIESLHTDDPLYMTAKAQAEATRDYLKAVDVKKRRSNDYRTFIAFQVSGGDEDIGKSVKEAFDYFFHTAKTDVSAFMGADMADISEARIRQCKRSADGVVTEQGRRLRLKPVTPSTIQWLLRRLTYRGTRRAIPAFRRRIDEEWTPAADTVELADVMYRRPRTRELVNLFSGEIYQESRYLRIEHDDAETSYQTFLTVTGLPEEQEFPGCEWLYTLQKENFGAEICVHLRAIEHRESLKKIDEQRRQANSQKSNIAEARAVMPLDLSESMRDIEDVEAELKQLRSPLLEVSTVFCLAGTDKQELEDAAVRIREMYEDSRFTIERPLADQLSLFFQCIPGVSFTVKDFILKLPPRALACGIFGATHELGGAVGYYIGTTGPEGKHVFEDFRAACLNNVSACAVFLGDLGFGKSFNANLLLYLHVLGGGYGLIIDPKGERTHWVTELTALRGHISLVTLAADPKYRGTLDPFNVFRGDVDEACDLALNLLTELFKIQPNGMENLALMDALKRIKEDPTPSMLRLAELLDDFPEGDDLKRDGHMLARRIRLQKESGMAQLLIGDGTEDAIRLDNRLNILQVQNMKLPSPETNRAEYTQEETVSSCLMMVITAFCRRFVLSLEGKFKAVLVDESWFMSKTPEGVKLIDFVARMSRSLYCSLILNGHSVNDLPEGGTRNAITYKFMFHTSSTEEAKRMLDFLRLEPTPENIGVLTRLGNRQALYQDRDGHVGVITFDAVFSDLIDVFSTTPEDADAKAGLEAARKEGAAYA